MVSMLITFTGHISAMPAIFCSQTLQVFNSVQDGQFVLSASRWRPP